jgi:micrococcal nuclease
VTVSYWTVAILPSLYPHVCIPPAPPDLDCDDGGSLDPDEVPYKNFTVRHDVVDPDPHGFDGNDNDGVGCET